jgi:hypothetical protein
VGPSPLHLRACGVKGTSPPPLQYERLLLTLMKVLDNIIQKPFDSKVRSIRLGNPAFDKKVASRRGGVEFLLACGFVKENPPPPLLTKGNEVQEAFLVLKDDGDETMEESQRHLRKEAYTSHIITARRLLLTRAIRDLHMKAEELPAYRNPPPPVATAGTNPASAAKVAFDPYQAHRYDGMSAAVGAQLTPDQNYESTTEKQLKTLQQQKERLEQKLQKDFQDRAWVASQPNASGKPTPIMAGTNDDNDDNKGTAGMIAAQFQKQQAERKQREEGGFTTKSMRELEKLKKQKVYTHTQLALQFSDGTVLQGKFLPKEKIKTVVEAMKECFVATPSESMGAIEIYVTPPRRTLAPTASLQDEGLVPAAKVFVKVALPNYRPFLKPELFQKAPVGGRTAAFPFSQPVVADKTKEAAAAAPAAAAAAPKEDKEEALLRRMMGGGRKLGSASGTNNSKKSKPGIGKPKWFK